MYKASIYNKEKIDGITAELIKFRAQITAKKLRSLGIDDSEINSVLAEIDCIPKEARGR